MFEWEDTTNSQGAGRPIGNIDRDAVTVAGYVVDYCYGDLTVGFDYNPQAPTVGELRDKFAAWDEFIKGFDYQSGGQMLLDLVGKTVKGGGALALLNPGASLMIGLAEHLAGAHCEDAAKQNIPTYKSLAAFAPPKTGRGTREAADNTAAGAGRLNLQIIEYISLDPNNVTEGTRQRISYLIDKINTMGDGEEIVEVAGGRHIRYTRELYERELECISACCAIPTAAFWRASPCGPPDLWMALFSLSADSPKQKQAGRSRQGARGRWSPSPSAAI